MDSRLEEMDVRQQHLVVDALHLRRKRRYQCESLRILLRCQVQLYETCVDALSQERPALCARPFRLLRTHMNTHTHMRHDTKDTRDTDRHNRTRQQCESMHDASDSVENAMTTKKTQDDSCGM